MRGALRLSEAPAQLWDEPALFTQQTAAAALRKKTDQARAKAHCPVRGGSFLSLPVGHPGPDNQGWGSWAGNQADVSPQLPGAPPILSRAQVGPAVPAHHSPFPSPKHLSQLGEDEEEVKG